MFKFITKALLASAVLTGIAGFGIASAQTNPPPSNSTPVQTAPKPATKKPPLVVLHLQSMATYNVGGSDLPFPSQNCSTVGNCGPTGEYQYAEPVVHFDYGAQINISRKFFLNYLHNYVDQNIGRVGVPSHVCNSLPCTAANPTYHEIPYTYQKLNDDRVDDASANYVMGGLTVAAGWHERVRMCCGQTIPESGANQTSWHDLYLGLTGRTGPNSKYFGRMFGLSVQGQEFLHAITKQNNDEKNSLGQVIPAHGDLAHVQFFPNITLPIGDPRGSTFALTGTYTNNIDYFNNSPIPYLYNQVDYGFVKKFPPIFTLTVVNSNLYQFKSAVYPYGQGDTINRNKLIMTLDAALPFF